MKRILFPILFIIFLSSCKKDDSPQYNLNIKGPLSVEFDNIAGSADLQLNSGSYTNAAGEIFTVTKLKYYISNFILTKTDGSIYVVPQDSSYFLIDESDESTHEPGLEVPEGEYKTLTFTVGIDSLRSTMDISHRYGVLDPAAGASDMYWNAAQGYKFVNIEGTSTASATGFKYHIGGYSSANINNIKTISLDLTARGVPQVKSGKETNIHLMVDILKLFNGTSNISIAANPTVMFDPFSKNIANNYSLMFKHDHTEN